MKRKGFTLIELLAVIVILAIIALIAVPIVMNIISKANKSAFKDSAYGIIKAGELYYSEHLLEVNGMESDKTFEFPNNIENLQIKGSMPSSGNMIVRKDGKVAIAISDGRYCITKDYNDTDVTLKENIKKCLIPGTEVLYKDSVLKGTDPKIGTGMIPVKVSNDGKVTKANIEEKWYDYSNKEWANIVTVTEASRDKYMNAEVDTVINEADILTYLVWIPRYKYKLWNTDNMASTGVDNSKVHRIEIEFQGVNESKEDGTCGNMYSGVTNGCYLTHPAFTFGSEELNGMWVGKFESGYNGATTTGAAQVGTADSSKVIIKPNAYSWRSINVSNMYKTVKGMNTTGNIYGLSTESDPHMMKNTEWGAVAYLSHSKYGINYEVRLNNNSAYMTGCGALTENKAAVSACENKYGTVESYPQSTTGNISGVFDMAGGAWEYVMGYTIGATTPYGSSGFTKEEFDAIDKKYYDTYTSTSAAGWNNRILGDATGEMGPFNISGNYTSSWYGDYAHFVHSVYPWFARGGGSTTIPSLTGAFYFSYDTGGASSYYSFRVVVLDK